ncbi:unannotated protein [freshwater metagenome]|uniref:Unannotated protein n=1 Tax=freshwater metagenome TaxID=449393 RepID=A0A6J5YIS4_9ZZZZ
MMVGSRQMTGPPMKSMIFASDSMLRVVSSGAQTRPLNSTASCSTVPSMPSGAITTTGG